jgi:hypothetical protein
MMPPGQAGSLSDSAYVDVVAMIMKANGAGGPELTAGAAMRSVVVPKP